MRREDRYANWELLWKIKRVFLTKDSSLGILDPRVALHDVPNLNKILLWLESRS